MDRRCKWCRIVNPSKEHLRKHVDYRHARNWMWSFTNKEMINKNVSNN